MREFEGCGRSMRWYDWLAGLLLLWFVCGVRAASVYKCTGADGSVAYQDKSCALQQQERALPIEPAPSPQPSPQYASSEPHGPAAHAARAAARRRIWAQDEEMSFECRASNGVVFYRHAACPKSLRASTSHEGKARSGGSSAAPLTVVSREVPRSEACTQIHRAGAIGRRGREHDEDVSTYERNLGHDPCR